MGRYLFVIVLFASLLGCSRAMDRQAHRSQALLDEAELLLDARYADKSEENSTEALAMLVELLRKKPDKLEWRLLRIRAQLMIFFSKNFLVIDKAPIQRQSLVRLPAPQDYLAYDELVVPAETEIKQLLNEKSDLTVEHKGFLHGNLAAILRLNTNTLEQADQEYSRAIHGYEKELRTLKQDKKLIGSHDLSIMQLENQIRALKLSQTEVALLARSWKHALVLLRQAMAGEDLIFFRTQFERLEREIADLENKIAGEVPGQGYSREKKILDAIRLKKERRLSKRTELGGQNPYQVQLAQAKISLADAQNNLIYRIICFYNQNDAVRLDEAREVLRTFYPDIDSKLYELLVQHS